MITKTPSDARSINIFIYIMDMRQIIGDIVDQIQEITEEELFGRLTDDTPASDLD